MKKIQSLDTPSSLRTLLDNSSRRELLIALVLLLAIISLAWISHPRVEPTRSAKANTAFTHSNIKYARITTVPNRGITPTPAFYLNTGTPLPPDWVNNAQETNSIVVGAIILVLIVLVGTLTSVRARK
jgi:hypothetical protein